MSYRVEKNNEDSDLVFEGWEKGIAPSPHKGVANIQNGNIATEESEVMASYGRVQQTHTAFAGSKTLGAFSSSTILINFATIESNIAGNWITVSGSTITGLSDGDYYVKDQSTNVCHVSQFYNGANVTGLGATGTASYALKKDFASPLAYASESYFNGTTECFRKYVLDNQGLVWVNDTGVTTAGITWFLPDPNPVVGATGLAILDGWLHVFQGITIWCKPTVNLGDSASTSTNYSSFNAGFMMNSSVTHFGFTGHQGNLYYTDGRYLGSIDPDVTKPGVLAVNTQSYASYTASGTTGTVSTLFAGSIPYDGVTNANRIPAVFFHALTAGAANPTALVIGTLYYIKWLPSTSGFTDTSTFEVYAAASGGGALTLDTGAVGTQYFNTYYPTSAGGAATIIFTPERLTLPPFEISQCMTEIGNNVIIGGITNTLYPWNQVDTESSVVISLPEANTQALLTVNQMAYVFAGNKGNIYITDSNAASLVLKVPDYCAGLDGTASSYIEPVFTWGGVMYLRGRVYFSILDQTSTKAGNCGGVWSFYPTQNLYSGQDTGLALRLENQNSYGTYSGVATVLIPADTQTVKSPQYWAAWYSSTSSPTYGIDFTDTHPDSNVVIETDLAPVGTLLNKRTYEQVEFKLSAPLANTESVTIKWRANSTDAYASMGTAIMESTTGLSGYFVPNFQGVQWLQLEITLTPLTSTSTSFVRLREVRVR